MSETGAAPPPARSGRGARVAVVLVVAALVVAFFVFDLGRFLRLDALKENRAALAAWRDAHPLAALASYLAVYVATTALSLPGAAVLTLAGGALFGVVVGTVVVSFASTIGATLAFLIARFVLRDAVRSRFGARLRPIEEGVARDGAFYLFTLRLVPLFPFFLVNLLMALTPIATPIFYGVSQVGMLPATIAYVYAGSRLAEIERLADVASARLIAAFVVLGLLPLVLRKLADALAARRVYRGQRKPRRFDYNMLVIGAGSAGLVSAYIAAAIKAKVALIEKDALGGDCLNTGCVPSKALLRTARLLAEARDSTRFGIARMDAQFDFAEVMARVQRVIAKIEPHDSVERYTDLGVEVIRGAARLVSPWEVEVNGRRLSARSIVVATGARPLVPKIPGLDGVPFVTSETLWDLRTLPRRFVVLGGGPIGCELAQAFARFGSAVTVVEMAPRLLPREDADVAAELGRRFAAEGITIAAEHRAVRVEPAGEGEHASGDAAQGGRLVCTHDGREVALPFDILLVALGRQARVTGFGLEELGVRLRNNGTIDADPLLRTNFPNILVCGDVTGPYQFTHVASHQAWYAAVNGLLAPLWSYRADYRVIPWCTFTEPEVARVGLSEDEARAQGLAFEVTRYGLDDLDRAIADDADEGFVKVLTATGSDRILGTTIVGAHAGELIAEHVTAMKHGLGMNKLLGTIHVYPTLMEANRFVAGAWRRAHASPTALRLAERFFAWRRG
jgi:pyruvate/2-oxoglutarate dehydrogenase complex dihydrolipoamide dehydrogenase (E3) component/uncharacterized membrane protein YdjX (TVP38/TMEM64 family)